MVLGNLIFSIFCGHPNLFLRNQHCLHIAFFFGNQGSEIRTFAFQSAEVMKKAFSKSKGTNFGPLLFVPLGSSGKNISSLFRKQGSEFWTLALRSAEIVNKNLCLKSKDPNFGPLLFTPLK